MKIVLFCIATLLSGTGQVVLGQKGFDYYLQQAYANSALLKNNGIESEANKREAEQVVESLRKPVIGLELNYALTPVYSSDEGNPGFKLNPPKTLDDYYGYDLSATNGGLYRGIATLDQPLFNGGRIRVAEDRLTIQNLILDNNTRVTRHELEQLVMEQYLLCLGDLGQEAAIKDMDSLISEQMAITQKLASGGLGAQSDYKLLNIELEHEQTLFQAAKDNYGIHLLGLNSLCGISDTTIVDLSPLFVSLRAEDVDATGFTRGYAMDSLRLEMSKKEFNLRYKPLVSLYSSAGLNAVYAPDMFQRFGWLAGIKVTQTLFDGRQRNSNERRIRLLQESASVNEDFFNKQNAARKASLLQQLRSIDQQIASITRQAHEYDDLLGYYKKQLVAGQLSVINYVSVLRSKASLQLNVVSLRTQKQIVISHYNYWNW